MAPSLPQLLIALAVALLVFGGRGRISSIMGDLAKGVRSFRDGIKEPEADGEKPMVDVTPDSEDTQKDG